MMVYRITYRVYLFLEKGYEKTTILDICSNAFADCFAKLVSAVEALSTILGVMVQCSVLFVSAYLIITGQITAGALVGLVQVSGTIVAPIQALSQTAMKVADIMDETYFIKQIFETSLSLVSPIT